jgi:hypothetical protein
MNDQQHTQNLNAITQDIQQLAQQAYQAILAKIGTAPASVIIRQVLKDYSLEVQSAVDSMMREYLSLGTPSNTPLAIVNGLVLSEHLYNNAMLAVAPVVTRIINDHAKEMKTARELAKAIYEGYDFKEDPLDVQKELPKYLHKPLAKLIASGLKTPALRAAYLQYLNHAGDKDSKADMAKLLQIAFYERNRYLANRIAQTELHRIHSDTRASEIMADDQVHWVQVRMSQTHPKYDICDYHANLNAYGKGKGIYPKGKAPKPPYHPFCRCKLSPVITIDPPKTPPLENKSASRAFISSLPTSQAVAILGSREKLAQFMKDKDLSVLGIVDQNKPKGYETRYVGEVGSGIMGGMKDFKKFISDALDKENKRHDVFPLINLSAINGLDGDWIKNAKLTSKMIKADTGSIRNLLTKGIYAVREKPKAKQKPTLTPLEVMDLPLFLQTPDRIYFDGSIIIVKELPTKEYVKIVIGLDNGVEKINGNKEVYHTIYSGMVFDLTSLENNLKDAKRIY